MTGAPLEPRPPEPRPPEPRPAPDPSGAERANAEFAALRLWQRFHIRLTALYGTAVLVTLTLLTWTTTAMAVNAELGALRERILGIASVSAVGFDVPALVAAPPSREDPVHVAASAQLQRALDTSPDLSSIYILLKTDQPTQLRFFADRSRGLEGQPGEIYDATALPTLLAGLERPTVEREPVADEFGLTMSGYAPLRLPSGESVGLVGVDVSAARIEAMKIRLFQRAALAYFTALLMLSVAALFVSRLLREPLTLMIAGSSAIARGLLSTRLKLIRSDEFGLLARHFDQMASGLEEREFIRATFGRYMSEDVARALLASPDALKPGGEEREVTILFSDLRGYSTISEHLSPTEVVALLNDFLGAMNAEIDRHNGCVIEFLGDAILAVFGAPVALPGHPEHAVRCALDMRAALTRLNADWDRRGLSKAWRVHGLDSLAMRVGIHTGQVVAGNLGSSHRMKYAVIGDAVNVAARLEALNKTLDTELLISDAVFAELSDELVAQATDRGTHKVKGRDQEVQVWSL